MKNLHAYTEMTNGATYPGYVNLSVGENTPILSLRGTGQANPVALAVPKEELLKLADAIYAQFAVQAVTVPEVTGRAWPGLGIGTGVTYG